MSGREAAWNRFCLVLAVTSNRRVGLRLFLISQFSRIGRAKADLRVITNGV